MILIYSRRILILSWFIKWMSVMTLEWNWENIILNAHFVSNYVVFVFVVNEWYLFLIMSTMWNDLKLHCLLRTRDEKYSIVVKSSMSYLNNNVPPFFLWAHPVIFLYQLLYFSILNLLFASFCCFYLSAEISHFLRNILYDAIQKC